MGKFPPLGVQAVVEGYNDYLRMMGGMSKATSDTHSSIGRLSVVPLAGGLIKGAAMATAAIVAIGAAAVGAGVAIGGMLLKVAEEAAPMLEMQEAFKRLTARAGSTAEATLQIWQGAVRETLPAIKLMEIYNTAARLLGDTFAQKLPEAMSLLRDAAEATGSDVTAFTTTFIKGVARMRVGTLAQLGIQIDLNDMVEKYAKKMGIKAEAVTDATKRELIYAESIRQLTADMEGLRSTENGAEEAFERLNVVMTDTKNEVKMAISKAMLPLGIKLGGLAKVYLPELVKAFHRKFIPVLEKTVAWLGKFLPKAILLLQIWWFKLVGAMKPITDYIKGKFGNAWTWLTEKVFPELIYRIDQVVNWLVMNVPPAIETVKRWADKVREWGQSLIDFWNTKVGPKLKTAWDWIVTNISPKVETVRVWLADKLTTAGATLSTYWNNTLGPALLTAWQWIVDNVGPKITDVQDWLEVNVPVATKHLIDYWQLTLAPALELAWVNIVAWVAPHVQDVIDWLEVAIPAATQTTIDKWNELKLAMAEGSSDWQKNTLPAIRELVTWLVEHLAPAITIAKNELEVFFAFLGLVNTFVTGILIPMWTALAKLLVSVVVKAFEALVFVWLEYVLPVIDKIWQAIRDFIVPWFEDWKKLIDDIALAISPLVGWIEGLAKAISNIGVPKALQQHSPSPLEKSLMGVRNQMLAINALGMPGFPSKSLSPVLAGPGGSAMLGGGSPTSNFNLTVNSSAPRESVVADYGLMKALARRR